MSKDFEPDMGGASLFQNNPELIPPERKERKPKAELIDVNQEKELISGNVTTSDVVTMNNLLGLTQSHINDDNECRAAVSRLTQELNDSIHLMSVKELIDYLKVKIREREFHVDCIFKAYAFIQKSEFAREMLVGSTRKERIIEVSDRKRITGLLNMLNKTE
jgi:hypothetical protein